MSAPSHNVALAEVQPQVINPTNSCCAFYDGVEHRLHVGGRAADNTEHLGGSCLMLQGFTQFCIALLDLREQPHVFYGYNGLVGESFKQLDLFLGKWANLHPTNHDRPDR